MTKPTNWNDCTVTARSCDNGTAVVNVEMPEDEWVSLYHYLNACMFEAGLKKEL